MSDDKKQEEEKEEPKPNTFTSVIKPPKDIEKLKQQTVAALPSDVNDSVLSAQEKVWKGLADTMSSITLENMQKLAPEDSFDIDINGNKKTFQRSKLKPKQIKELRQASRIYAEDIKNMEDPDLRLDRDQQLLAYKANLYLGMTDSEFENCDVEYLSQVIQATELRTQGFRKC